MCVVSSDVALALLLLHADAAMFASERLRFPNDCMYACDLFQEMQSVNEHLRVCGKQLTTRVSGLQPRQEAYNHGKKLTTRVSSLQPG